MIRLLFVNLVLLLLSLATHAQEAEMQCGPILKFKGLYTHEKVIGSDREHFYTLRIRSSAFRSDRYTMLKYNYRMELIWERRVPVTSNNRLFETVLNLQGKMLLFTSGKENGLQCAWVQEISRDGKLKTDPLKIDEMPPELISSRGIFDFSLSSDSAGILIHHREPIKSNELTEYSFRLMDSSLSIIWQKKFLLEAGINPSIIQISSRGNMLYFLRKLTEKADDQKIFRRYSSSYIVHHYDAELKQESFHSVYENAEKEGNMLLSVRMTFAATGKLHLAGIYSKISEWDPIGFVSMVFDPHDKTIGIRKSLFEERLAKQLQESDEHLFTRTPSVIAQQINFLYTIREILADENEQLTFVVEKYASFANYRSNEINTMGVVPIKEEHHFYKEILLVHTSAQGVTIWTSLIPKEQHTLNDGGQHSSFKFIPYEDYFKVLYNDNQRNLDTGYRYSMTDPRKASMVIVEVDQEGGSSKSVIAAAKEQKTIFIPSATVSIGPERYLLYWKYKNYYRFCLYLPGQ